VFSSGLAARDCLGALDLKPHAEAPLPCMAAALAQAIVDGSQ